MAKSSGNTRRGGKRKTLDINAVKKGLMVAGAFNSREARWNNNASYHLGFHDDAQLVIDDVAKGRSFASKVAQSVKQNNYRISEKQAYVIAKEAVEKKNKFLFGRDKKPKVIFESRQETVKITKRPKGYKFPEPKEIRKALQAKGLSYMEADKIISSNYNSLRNKYAGKKTTKDILKLFLDKA